MTKDPFDRTVHAVLADGTELARYDKAGKWFAEKPDGTRKAITLTEAANLAAEAERVKSGSIRANRYGGTMFNAKVRGLLGITRQEWRSRGRY